MLSFELDPPLTPRLREELVILWTDVAAAGGPIGFVPPVTVDDVRPVADEAFAGVTEGVDHLLIGRESPDAPPVAALFVASNRFALKEHWRILKRVMVDPKTQGQGYGVALMREAEKVARAAGWSGLHVTVRDGHGLDAFYARLGYVEVGRLPSALRVADGDDRDELFFWLAL